MNPTHTAIGTWSGGRFMHFGEALDDAHLETLLRPGEGIDTVMSADAYGAGEADSLLGKALRGVDRDSYCLIGAIGHDFYKGEREGAKGFPRFTDSRLRGEDEYGDYIRMATERSLERLGVERFDLLLLHNPDRTGYTSDAVWAGMEAVREAGLTRLLGVAPGPANGFTLDLIDCLERHGESIDWAMVILSPMEPWPGELVLDAVAAHDVSLITRVVDYGGLFHDDVRPGHAFAEYDHRKFRPDGWVEAGMEKLERMRPYAERHGLSLLQLACQWNLAHPSVRCVAPTLIQETEANPAHPARAIEDKRAELAALPADVLLSATEVDQLHAIGDNTGSMALKGANPAHEGAPRPDRWGMSEELVELAARWEIAPERDLAQLSRAT
ncbi:MAG TPA: aldo/keto reductase [Solirubrobacteraceae bacterium]|jgi:aryl-alcohol dehydrogenase-like predicted oxidoreductase